ncbi:MAG: methyltransferase domain-containing protein [Chitinophagia bacterium]|nr:methyltransferase domain-containing protein [Chitinophagia bacterium]
MSGGNFAFKQFTIMQEHCAMKVTTDACLLGACAPMSGNPISRFLDIGTGTGLLMLMLAQRFADALIDGVEIEPNAYQQAMHNIAQSPWSKRLHITNIDVCQYKPPYQYDAIICNPPFFIKSLKNTHSALATARHDTSLTYTALIDAMQTLLLPNGSFTLLLPADTHAYMENLSQKKGFYLHSALHIKHLLHSPVKRIISTYATMPCPYPTHNELSLYTQPGTYSQAFIALMQPFYLYL